MTEDINAKVAQEPTAPQPKAEPAGEPQGEPKDEAALLMDELRNLGIDNPEKLQNMATASSQVGKAYNEVGELRKMNQQLQSKLDQVLSAQTQPQDPYSDGQSIDLGAMIENKLESFWNKQTQKQNELTERYYSEMNNVRSHPRFPAVEKMFDAHINSPETAMRLRQGQTTLTEEFHRVKDVWTDKLLERSMKALGASQPSSAQAPHVESGDTQSIPLPSTDDERADKIKNTVKARQDGSLSSDDALQKIVDSFLPSDDPIWRM